MKMINRYFIFSFLFLLWSTQLSALASDKSFNEKRAPIGSMRMKVDPYLHAKAFFAGIPVVPSIFGRLEIFERNLNGTRNRLAIGPWQKSFMPWKLSKISETKFLLNSEKTSSGASFQIRYEQIDQTAIKVSGEITAPPDSMFPFVDYEILRIPGELFKGAKIKVMPGGHESSLPVEPRPMERRSLYKGKNEVLIENSLCTIKIKDLTGRGSINIADLRNFPFARLKSFYFYNTEKMSLNGKNISFNYLIEILPSILPSSKTDIALIDQKKIGENKNFWEIFSPDPKYSVKKQGVYRLQPTDFIISNNSNKAARVLSDALKKMTGYTLTIISNKNHSDKKGIFINCSQITESGKKLTEEGYEIVVKEKEIRINGNSLRGTLYGVYSVLGLLQNDKSEWNIPCGVSRDWPDLPIRAFYTELLFPAVRDVNLFKRYIDTLSYARANTIIFYFYPAHLLDWKEKRNNGRWTPAQIKEVVTHARSMGMNVWTGMVSRFNKKTFPELNILSGSEFYDPLDDYSYNYLTSLYKEAISVTNPDLFLIGHDEIKGLSEYSKVYGKTTSELFTFSVRKLHNWLKGKGIRTALSGDMLLDNSSRTFPMDANSNNPIYNSGATHLAIDRLPKDVAIVDWHYGFMDSYQSINYFVEKGFDVYGCSWFKPRVAKKMVETVLQSKAKGIIGSDWGFWATLSPSATSIANTLYGWQKDHKFEKDNDLIAFSQAIKSRNQNKKWERQEIVDLLPVVNATHCKSKPTEKEIDSDFECDLAVCTLPKKLITMSGIEYQTLNSCISVNSNPYSKKSSKISIPLEGKKAKALAFLNTVCIETPVYRVRDLGYYIIEYSDGKKEILKIREGWNITDFKSFQGSRSNDWSFSRRPEIILGADLAWSGNSSYGIPTNLQSTLWYNPNPEKSIKSVTIVSNKDSRNWNIILLGVTILQ